ncbi:MAG: hypothetical protein K2K98_03460 [Muribaculaceae bacterium]|nr:hypothetical protein [Muribaculaceae bacterium]
MELLKCGNDEWQSYPVSLNDDPETIDIEDGILHAYLTFSYICMKLNE